MVQNFQAGHDLSRVFYSLALTFQHLTSQKDITAYLKRGWYFVTAMNLKVSYYELLFAMNYRSVAFLDAVRKLEGNLLQTLICYDIEICTYFSTL